MNSHDFCLFQVEISNYTCNVSPSVSKTGCKMSKPGFDKLNLTAF